MQELALVAAAWLAFGALHSWFASIGLKQRVAARWPAAMPAYRLLFNGAALLLLIPPLWLTHRYAGAPLWIWPGWISYPAAIAAIGGFLWTFRWYDASEFLGLRQWRQRHEAHGALRGFVVSPFHRFVRHPWYALGLSFLWTRDLNAAWLVAAVAITVYLVVGSRIEEQKLLDLYGDAYGRYRARVPGLLPWPGRSLRVAEALALEGASRKPDESDWLRGM